MAASSELLSPDKTNIYDSIKKDHDEAFFCIEKAMKLDAEGKKDEAISMYEFGLTLMDKALSVPIDCPREPDIAWEKTYVMLQKMRKTRKEILIRISDCQSRPHPDSVAPPPSYEEAMAASASSTSTTVIPQPSNSQSMMRTNNNVRMSQPYIPSSALYDPILGPVPHSSTLMTDSNVPASVTYSDLSNQLQNLKVENKTPSKEILYQCQNVRLYFISPDGRVSSTSEPDTLIIGRLEDSSCDILDDVLSNLIDQISSETNSSSTHRKRHHHKKRRHHHHHHRHRNSETSKFELSQDEPSEPTGRLYLQVGSWVYPLIPGVSPCYRSEYGAFILPDCNSHINGAAVGLILPPEVDESVHELLNSILHVTVKEDLNDANRRHRRSRRSERATDKLIHPLAANIVKGANYLSEGLIKGASSTGKFIDDSTPKLITRLQPGPTQNVNPTVMKSIEAAKTVSSKAVSATEYLANKVGSASSALGRYLAPYIQEQGTSIIASTTKSSPEEAARKMSSVLDVAAGTVQGMSTLYQGLETSAVILARSLSQNTVHIIAHKYGLPAGQFTSDAFATLGNVIAVRSNAHVLKPKGIVKTAAKETGKAVLEDHKYDLKSPSSFNEFQGPGPGSGPDSSSLGSK